VHDLADRPGRHCLPSSSTSIVSTLIEARPADPAWLTCSWGRRIVASGAISVWP
jgi:hypothetical protein